MDEALILIQPTEAYADQVYAYRQEFLDSGDPMDGTARLRQCADPLEWLELTRAFSHPDSVPPGWVQMTQFICVRRRDDRLLGMLHVRHTFNDYLERYGGHIGYSVRPSERRKGYAAWMLRAALPFCREIGLKRVLVTCLKENEASRRTVLKNGGQYECTVYEPDSGLQIERYWIDLENKSL